MCHSVLKLHSKAQRRRETSSSPQVTEASLPLMDQPHRQETASSAAHPHRHEHTCSPLPLKRGGRTVPAFPGAGGRDGAGGTEALRGTGLCRELLRASRWSYSKRQQTGNPIWQPQQAPVGLWRWFLGGGGKPTHAAPCREVGATAALPRMLLKPRSLSHILNSSAWFDHARLDEVCFTHSSAPHRSHSTLCK